ncbi:MAG: hypothetical protein A3A33_00995 [Candidatus Yanofskybacteria bacterium RIFCSPLOWO2_01_FULL_49_25]|uniref:Uncharacterized protein n=1 Tax=Candidatus Yanofskybacteria bacterium RIFCSPLOWO2_01_FULL_49_25 TaxID=1802701 RepID=A0A1F8GYW7_9BACT|nr:MAG: hypothetical protein A3A33_00995 [Candidatus Yanofskybacteria bacterium RIFCSPLOWO2_01_FULL_49_25]
MLTVQTLRRVFSGEVKKATIVVLASFAILFVGAHAGSLTPPASPASTMYTLSNIWDTIASGTYDSSGISASGNGSAIQILKQINANTVWSASGNNIYKNASGRVGIGDTTPEAFFEIASASGITASISNTFYVDASTQRVGIGTTVPGQTLTVNGTIESFGGTVIAPTYVVGTAGVGEQIVAVSSGIQIQTNNIERLRILNGGFIGIGTSAPTTSLEVQGTASASYLLTGNTIQVGGHASMAYSRFGTATTTHSLSTSSDLLVSGRFEVDASASFDGQLIIKNTLDTGNIVSMSAIGLTTGNLIYMQVPASGGFILPTNFSGNLILAKDTLGNTMFRVKSGGELAARQAIFSHGSTSNCTGTDAPIAGCIDYAEDMPTRDPALQAGDIISLNMSSTESFSVIRSLGAYDRELLGVVSTKPAIVIGSSVRQGDLALQKIPGVVPVALSGRVPVNISFENGDIHRGDYITSSLMPGKGMRATHPGRVVGIALEDALQSNGTTRVLVFINPHYAGYELDASGMLADFTGAKTTFESSGSTSSFASILDAFKSAILTVAKLIANQIETRDLTVIHGITTYDQVTNAPYCLQIISGQLQVQPGACVISSPQQSTSPSSTDSGSPAPSPSTMSSPSDTATPTETSSPSPTPNTESPSPDPSPSPTPTPS